MRRLVRILIVLLVGAAALIGLSGVASAGIPHPSVPLPGPLPLLKNHLPNPTHGLLGNCKTAPEPAMPGSDSSGWLAGQPKPVGKFNASTTNPDELLGIYGRTSWQFHTYDLGCMTDPTNAIQSSTHNAVDFTASVLMGIVSIIAAVGSALLTAVLNPAWLAALDPMIAKVTGAFAPVWHAWAPVSIAVLGFIIVCGALSIKKGTVRKAAEDVFWMVAIVGLVAITLAAPTLLAKQVDTVVRGGAATAAAAISATSGKPSQQTDPADAITGKLDGEILYSQWLQGELGCQTCAAATHNNNGLRLFDAQHYTLAEAKIMDAGGAAAKQIKSAKQQEFVDAASDVGNISPAAYDNLQGTNNNRIWVALITLVSLISVYAFIFASCLLIIIALLTVRVLVIMLPILALIGIIPAGRATFMKAVNTASSAVVTSLVFFFAAMVNVALVGAVMSPDVRLPGALRIIICAIFSAVLWKLLKPHRKALTAAHKASKKVTGPVTDAAAFAGGAAVTGGAAAVGMYAADKAAGHSSHTAEGPPRRGEAWLAYNHRPPSRLELDAGHQPAIGTSESSRSPNGEDNMPIDPIYSPADTPDLDVGDYAPVKQKVFKPTVADQPAPEIVTVEDDHGVHYDPSTDPSLNGSRQS